MVLTPVVAWFMLREKLNFGLVGPIVLTVLGLITGSPNLASLGWGDGLCFLASLLYSVSTSLNCRYLQTSPRPSFLSTTQFAACGILCLGHGFAFEHNTAVGLLRALPQVLFLGVIGKALPYFLTAYAQNSVGVGPTNLFVSAEAPFSALAAFLMIGETMSATALRGAVQVIVAIAARHISKIRAVSTRLFLQVVIASRREPSIAES